MDKHTAVVLSKMASRFPGWTVLGLLVHGLPLIISALVGTAGAASLFKFLM